MVYTPRPINPLSPEETSFRNRLQRRFDGYSEAEKRMIAGGIAGSMGKTVTAPLSRITVLYQVGSMIEGGSSGGGKSAGGGSLSLRGSDTLSHSFQRILRKEGILAFWKGNLTSVIHRFPYSAINFAAFEASRDIFCNKLNMEDSTGLRFTCGALSGAAACIACYPLDLVRTKLTVSDPVTRCSLTGEPLMPGGLFPESKIVNILRHILNTEGVLGMYRGLSAALVVSIPSLAIGFSVYGIVKDRLLCVDMGKSIFVNEKTGHLNPYGSLLSGSISGMTSSMVMFPADVVRKRMQVSTSVCDAVTHSSSSFYSHSGGAAAGSGCGGGGGAHSGSGYTFGNRYAHHSNAVKGVGGRGGGSLSASSAAVNLHLPLTSSGAGSRRLVFYNGSVVRVPRVAGTGAGATVTVEVVPAGNMFLSGLHNLSAYLQRIAAGYVDSRHGGGSHTTSHHSHHAVTAPTNSSFSGVASRNNIDFSTKNGSFPSSSRSFWRGSSIHNGGKRLPTGIDIFLGILRKDGVRGFYRGLLPEQLKVTPMVAVTFCMYELTSDFLNGKGL